MTELLEKPTLSHPLLDPHQIIAWDMDQTLIGGPNSEFFRAYILAHPEKEHHIVTFRTGPSLTYTEVALWRDECVYELNHEGMPHGTIRSISSLPDDLDLFGRVLSSAEADMMMTWKGKTAKGLGATVLVDDMQSMVERGCERYGVTFVHAHDPRFAQA